MIDKAVFVIFGRHMVRCPEQEGGGGKKRKEKKLCSALQIDRQDENKMVYRDVRFDLSIKTFGCQIETSNLSLKPPLLFFYFPSHSQHSLPGELQQKKMFKVLVFHN